jgi:serine/threonine protein kinase
MRINAVLDHPAIVRTLSWGRLDFADGGVLFTETDFAGGEPLLRWNRAAGAAHGSDLLDARRLRLAYALAAALESAHTRTYTDDLGNARKGVVHGNLKPGNIHVTHDDRPLIMDFGMAAIAARTQALPVNARPNTLHPSTLLEVEAFRPTEQRREGIVTPVSDVYSLGVLLLLLACPSSQNSLLSSQGIWGLAKLVSRSEQNPDFTQKRERIGLVIRDAAREAPEALATKVMAVWDPSALKRPRLEMLGAVHEVKSLMLASLLRSMTRTHAHQRLASAARVAEGLAEAAVLCGAGTPEMIERLAASAAGPAMSERPR